MNLEVVARTYRRKMASQQTVPRQGIQFSFNLPVPLFEMPLPALRFWELPQDRDTSVVCDYPTSDRLYLLLDQPHDEKSPHHITLVNRILCPCIPSARL